MHNLRRALALLTILPVRVAARPGDNPGAAMAWYPLVGLFIGSILVTLHTALLLAGPQAGLLAAALTLAAWVLLTGGLHLDGWGDCCDGLLCALPRERRLEIMKDPHAGNFAVTGLAMLLLVKFAVLAVLPPVTAVLALLLAPVTARWAVVVAAKFWPNARPGGMGATFRAGLGPVQLAAATLTCGALVIWSGLPGLLALGGALFALLLVVRLAMAQLGGLTGDVYGAIIEGAETAALIAGALTLG